ncbi:Hypothetical protein A7982_00667 [Minicystis rosea]|nr:Hypothetical protein A7982_00667 [Minicystis rosea]
MTRAKLLILAASLALFTTGCGKNGFLAFAAGMELIAATATVASEISAIEEARTREESAREAMAQERARQEAERAAARRRAQAAPVVVVVEPACTPQ